MLGETFEMVGKNYRFIGEKVAHSPDQINAFVFEGENFVQTGYYLSKNKFEFYGGRGKMVFSDPGTNDFYLKEYDEYITVQKPIIMAKNIIFGGLYVDLDG